MKQKLIILFALLSFSLGFTQTFTYDGIKYKVVPSKILFLKKLDGKYYLSFISFKNSHYEKITSLLLFIII